MITRRSISLAIGGGVMLSPAMALAQTPGSMRWVGLLEVASQATSLSRREAFKLAMRGFGWVEGRNVEFRIASADGRGDRIEALATSLVAAQPEVIVTSSAVSTRALQKATATIPIVMVNVVDPVANGFAESLARPGGNITGMTNQQEDLFPKLVQFLLQLAPKAQRVGFLFNENNPSYRAYRIAAQRLGLRLGLTPVVVTASSSDQLAGAVGQLVAQRAGGVVVTSDPIYTGQAAMLARLLLQAQLVAVFGLRDHAIHGGLLSYGVNLDERWRNAAKYVDKILKGAKAGELPIEQPTRFELVVNVNAARMMGLSIPQALLLRADEVIQ